MINQEQLDKDKAICEAATDGPWENRGHTVFNTNGKSIVFLNSNGGVDTAEHIARFNPSYMLQYIQELEARQEIIEKLSKKLGDSIGAAEKADQELQAARERIEKLEGYISNYLKRSPNIDCGGLYEDERLLSQHNTDSEGE